MNKIETAIVAEFLLLTSYVVTHVLVSRYLQPLRRWRAIKQIFFPFALGAVAIGYLVNAHAQTEAPRFWYILSAFVIVWLIHIGYLTVYAVFDRSITLRTMIEMRQQPGTSVSFAEIEKLYDPDASFGRRLDILVENGFMVKENEKYQLTQKGKRTGRFILSLKMLYRTGEGG